MLMEMFMPHLFFIFSLGIPRNQAAGMLAQKLSWKLGDVYDPLYNWRILSPETQFLCDVFNFISSCFWN